MWRRKTSACNFPVSLSKEAWQIWYFIFMENEEALPFSMDSQVDESIHNTGNKPLSSLEKACLMQGEASAETIVDEITNNDSMHWQMNLQVKQEQNNDDDW